MRIKIWLYISTLALLVSCSLDYNIRTQSDPDQDFYNYKTYTFLTDNDTTGVSQLDRQVIRFLEDQIADRILDLGMYQETTDPQLVIYYEASLIGINKNTAKNRKGYKDLPGMGYTYIMNDYNQYKSKEGTLTINFYDRKRAKIVWQGMIVMDISDNREKNLKYMAKAIGELFEKYPVKAKK